MRCLFCKADSSSSRSVEHVIPQALGNTQHVLPRGVVCDACNNYFAKSVEKPFLEAPGVRALRFFEAIESKKGRIPPIQGILTPGFAATVTRHPRQRFMSVETSADGLESLLQGGNGMLILPTAGAMPTGPVVSRFLAKIALESMAARLVDHPDGLTYLCEEPQLDPIREHARRGRIPRWPVHIRRIYPSDAQVVVPGRPPVQVVHEADFLVTASSEWYFVMAIFGVEFTINMAGPEVDGYLYWLAVNAGASPLYSAKNLELQAMPVAVEEAS